VLDTIAFAVWNVGTRPPAQLIADIRTGIRQAPIRNRGLVRFAIGAVALLAGALIAAPAVARTGDLPVVEFLTVITALITEQLVGPDLRARYR
jgi:hypothetical protein